MDYLILQFYREVFKKQSNGLDFMQNKKAFIKMIETVEKQRKILSAIQKHKGDLDALGIKLTTIELVGGGTRIPSFIRIIQNLFKVDPSRTINSSEAIAKGCAIMSAFKNPLFRPSDFTIE
jgi:molecular chaperone DnaK (HSP70)